MLATSGYFKSIPCPFFENGLCERPHCHFKHVRKKDTESCFSVNEEENPTDLLRIVNEAVKRMEKEVESGVIDTENDEAETSTKAKPQSKSSKTVLEYKPTPIAQLKKMQQENKYAKALAEPTDDLEYDPLTNYSAGLPNKVVLPVAAQANKIPYVPSKRSVLEKMKVEKQSGQKLKIDEEDGQMSLSDLELSDKDSVIPTSTESSPVKVKGKEGNDKFDIVNQILTESSICEKAISKKSFSIKDVKSKKSADKKSESKSKSCEKKKTSNKSKDKSLSSVKKEKESVKKKKELGKSKTSPVKSESKKQKSKKSPEIEQKKLKLNAKTETSSKKKSVLNEKTKSENKKLKIELPKIEKEKSIAVNIQQVLKKEKTEKMLSDFESTEESEEDEPPIDIVSSAFMMLSDSDLDEHDTEAECRRIFEEFVPTQPVVNGQFKAIKRELPEDDSTNVNQKKRVAHDGCLQNRTTIKRSHQPAALSKASPSQVMLNRYAKLKHEREDHHPNSIPSTSSSSAFLSTVSSALGKKRIAHVPNVSALINPVSSVPKNKQNVHHSAVNTTVAQSTVKGGSRVAHIPTQLSPRPMITQEYGSKVPTNVRQRYLNMIIDETLKLYPDEKDAYTRGLAEESNAYSRSSNRSVYLNVAVNTIHRIRNEVNGVLPQSPPQNPTVIATSMSTKAVPVAKKNQQNSISHEFVLGGKRAANVSYSIERRRSSLTEEISAQVLYEALQPYLLAKEQFDENGYPRPHPTEPGKAVIIKQDPKKKSHDPVDRVCSRCGARYKVSSKGVYLNRDECVYHWGRAHKRRIAGSIDNRYSCCQGDLESEGCCVSQLHVSENVQYDNLRGFVTTMQKSSVDSTEVFALDCEMSYTVHGLELTRVTVVDWQLKPVYETLVKPDNAIIDYNTKFSGITESDMEGVTTTLRDVQAVLLNKFSKKTILIGHSLESDFLALKFIHDTVVDTSVVFPHRLGPPYKRALRNLMGDYLNKIIQNNLDGHDSQEDAVACMELMLWKVREDLKKKRF